MIFVVAKAFPQNQAVKSGKMLLLQTLKVPAYDLNLPLKGSAQSTVSKQVIAPDFYVTQLGFFCKQEIKLEKTTKIPFRFRLGSVEDCDRMEGKHRRN